MTIPRLLVHKILLMGDSKNHEYRNLYHRKNIITDWWISFVAFVSHLAQYNIERKKKLNC